MRPRLLIGLLSGLVAAGCSGTGSVLTSRAEPTTTTSEAPAAADPTGSPTTPPGTAPFEVEPVMWGPCGSAQCGDLIVPLDHARPDGPTISIAMARVAASGDAAARLGSLFVNFGGPGGEGTETVVLYARGLPPLVRERFDVVSWDPRGVEDTEGLGCDAEFGDEPNDLVDPVDGFDQEITADREVWDRVMACVAQSPVLDDLGTVAVVNDLDLMRQAVGDERLTYLGLSYGTQIGWVYATLYPDHVRAMVLDGAVPPPDPADPARLSQAVAVNAAIDRFDQGCARSVDCAVRDEGYRATIERLARELSAEPIPLPDGTTFGPVDLVNLVIQVTYLDPQDIGAFFSQLLAALDAGDVGPLTLLADAFEGGSDNGAFVSVTCADGDLALTPAQLTETYARVLEISPLQGMLRGGIFCDTFPGEIDGLPPLDTEGTPTLLVIGNTGDNATPYADAVRLDGLLADSVLLTYDGSGHTITTGDSCIDGFVADYLVDLVAPPPGTRCGRTGPPDGWFVPVEP